MTLSDKTIYCAGPIDLADGKKTINWREVLITIANRINAEQQGANIVTIFNPATAYKVACPSGTPNINGGKYIEKMNNQAIDLAHAIIAFVPHDIPSVGTPIEIDYAYRNGKPLFVLSTIPYGKSIYLTNRVPPSCYKYLADVNQDSVDSALYDLLKAICDDTKI